MLLEWMKLSSSVTDYKKKKNPVSKTTEHRLYFKTTISTEVLLGNFGLWPWGPWQSFASPCYRTPPPQWFCFCLTANGIQEQDDSFDLASKVHRSQSAQAFTKRNTEAWPEWRSQPVDCETQSSQTWCPVAKGLQDTGVCLCRRSTIPNTNLISNDTKCWAVRRSDERRRHGCETWALFVHSCCKLWHLQKSASALEFSTGENPWPCVLKWRMWLAFHVLERSTWEYAN